MRNAQKNPHITAKELQKRVASTGLAVHRTPMYDTDSHAPGWGNKVLQQRVSRDGRSQRGDGTGLVQHLVPSPGCKVIGGGDFTGRDAMFSKILG